MKNKWYINKQGVWLNLENITILDSNSIHYTDVKWPIDEDEYNEIIAILKENNRLNLAYEQ